VESQRQKRKAPLEAGLRCGSFVGGYAFGLGAESLPLAEGAGVAGAVGATLVAGVAEE
jgi:hypothetical protein